MEPVRSSSSGAGAGLTADVTSDADLLLVERVCCTIRGDWAISMSWSGGDELETVSSTASGRRRADQVR